jgi:hypothetical protein
MPDKLTVHGVPLTTVLRLNKERTIPLERYEEDGHIDRFGYLYALAKEHGMDFATLLAVLDYMPPSEDFDGLVTTVEDFAMLGLGAFE